MKIWFFILSFCISILTTTSCTQQNSDSPLPSKDSLTIDGFANADLISFDSKFATLEDNSLLKINTSKTDGKFTPVVLSKKLSPDSKYTLKFKYRIQSPDPSKKFFHILVRTGANDDIVWTNEGDSAQFKEVEIKFQTPPLQDKLYSIQIHTYGKLVGDITDFRLYRGFGEKFYPARARPTRYTGDIGIIPTGAKEFEVKSPSNQNKTVVNAADFGVIPDSKDFVKNLNLAINHCKKISAAKLIVPHGTYFITENETVFFEGLSDFEFDGNDSTFIFKKTSQDNFDINSCQRIVLRNFKMDWDWKNAPIASLVEVVDINTKDSDSYFDAKFLEYEKFPNPDARITILTGYDDINKNINSAGLFTRVMEMTKGKGQTRRKWISPNILRVYYSKNDLAPFKIGQKFIFAHYYYDMTAIKMFSNTNLKIENVEIQSCAGHAFVVDGEQKYWEFNKVKVGIPQNSNKRYFSSAGDVCHIAYSNGFFKVIDCDFADGNDDCINVHDCVIYASKTSEKDETKNQQRTLTTKSSRYIYSLKIGDKIELRNDDYSPTGFVSYVTDIRPCEESPISRRITFADELPEQKGKGFLLFNRRYGSENIIIRNSKFHDTKARALLLLANAITVENCTFKNLAGCAIQIETGYLFDAWSEGYGVDNVVIRNNKFIDANARNTSGGRNAKDILISTYTPYKKPVDFPILTNILIENNLFENSIGMIAQIASASNVIIRNNTVEISKPFESYADIRGSFSIVNSSNIKIVNNDFSNSKYLKNPGVIVEEKSTSEITSAGNKILK